MEDIDVPHGLSNLPLPPIGNSPRGQGVELAQPRSLNTPRTPRPQSRVSPSPRWAIEQPAEDKPRRSLKQVSSGHREWTHEIGGCCEEVKPCVITCLCPCIAMWNVAESLDEPCMSAWMPCTCMAIRTKVRTIGGIKGSVLGDCCMTMCCPCLTICQLTKEVDHMALQPELYVKPVKD